MDVEPGTEIIFKGDGLTLTAGGVGDNGYLNFKGTEANQISVTTKAGYAPASMVGNYYAKGVNAKYVNFSNMGSMTFYPRYSGQEAVFNYCTFDNCGKLTFNPFDTTATIEVTYCDFRNGTDSYAGRFTGSGSALLDNNTMDAGWEVFSTGNTITNNVIVSSSNCYIYEDNTVTDNFIDCSGASSTAIRLGTSFTFARNYIRGAVHALDIANGYGTGGLAEYNVFDAKYGSQENVYGAQDGMTFYRNIFLGYTNFGALMEQECPCR